MKPLQNLLALLVAGTMGVGLVSTIRAEYVAETGRTVQVALPQDAQTAADGQEKVYEVPLEDLFSAELAAQIKASGVDRMAVQSEGVNTSLRTWADIQVNGVTGKGSLKLKDGTSIPPLYMALAMVYENQLWVRAPILPLESPELGKLLQLPYGKGVRVAPTTIMKNKTARILVMAALADNQAQLAGLTDQQKRALRQFGSHLATFLNLPGELRMIPMAGQSDLWIAPSHIQRPELMHSPDLAEQVRALNLSQEPYISALALDKSLKEAFTSRNGYAVSDAVVKASAGLAGSPGYMTAGLLQLDYIKAGIKPYQKASWIFLLSFVAFIAYLMSTKLGSNATLGNDLPGSKKGASNALPQYQPAQLPEPVAFQSLANSGLALAGLEGVNALSPAQPIFFRKTTETVDAITVAEGELTAGYRPLWWLAFSLLSLGCLFLFGAMVARFALGGRMPVSNMFEAITFCLSAFALLAVMGESWLRRGWIGISGAFFGWTLMMAVNMLPMHQRKVEPLIAVLDSMWLNYHVTALLVSYACFLLAFGCSVIHVTKLRFGNTPGLLPRAEVFENIAFRSTQVGWPLLTFGIFLGAVWANTAWGSYWSWDPKETWALITWFGYTIYLHMRMIVGWKDQRAGWVNILGFVLVLITFFGVSYLPGLSGGMHSYANPISR